MKKDVLDNILTEMFSYVGESYSDSYVQENGWFLKNTWTEAEQEKFKEWLSNFLYKKKHVYSKKESESAASYFILNYGWKVK